MLVPSVSLSMHCSDIFWFLSGINFMIRTVYWRLIFCLSLIALFFCHQKPIIPMAALNNGWFKSKNIRSQYRLNNGQKKGRQQTTIYMRSTNTEEFFPPPSFPSPTKNIKAFIPEESFENKKSSLVSSEEESVDATLR